MHNGSHPESNEGGGAIGDLGNMEPQAVADAAVEGDFVEH